MKKKKRSIASLCAKPPYCSDYIYSQSFRIASQWLEEHKSKSANPLIRGIEWGSVEHLDLIAAIKEAYVAGMVMGSCLQRDEYETSQYRI